jgi:hypothetical protein
VSSSFFGLRARASSLRFGVGLAALAATVAGLGCSGNVVAEPTGGSSQRLAVVEVRLHAAATETESHLDASARFVAVREPGVANDALDLLGLSYREPLAGGCVLLDADATARPLPAVRVDLRDLSPVSVEVRGEEGDVGVLPLEARAFPDVGGLVSGVVFVAPAVRATHSTPRGASLTISGVRLGELELPDVPRVQLMGAVSTDDALAVDARGFDLYAVGSAPESRLSLDVVRAGVTRARCGVDANGRTHVDATALGGAGDVTLVVRDARHVVREEATLGTVDARVSREIELKLLAR